MVVRSRNILFPALMAWTTAACANSSTAPNAGEFEGVYYSGFEVSNFQPCHNEERWWLSAENAEIWRQLEEHRQDAEPFALTDVFIKVEARVPSDENKTAGYSGLSGGYGHLGMYDREIVVTRVLENRAVTDDDLERCTVAADRGYPSASTSGH